MGVLLGLGDAQLGQPQTAEILTQPVLHGDAGPRYQHVGHGGVVLRVAHVGGGEEFPLEPVEVRVHDGAGDLTGAVGAVVEEDDAVVVADGALAVAHHRLHELIGDVGGVALCHGVHGIGVVVSLAVHHGVVGHLHPLPALVTVHGVVAAHDRGDLAHAQLRTLVRQRLDEALAAGGGHIAPVQEAVEIHALKALVLGHPHQRVQVVDMGVYAAVGQQAVQMQGGTVFQAVVHSLVVGLVLEEAAILNGAADAGQILKHHAAAADVGVAHLAVAHLPCGQTHVQSAGGQGGVGVFLKQPVQHRRLGQGDGVVVRRRRDAEAVHDDKGRRSFVHACLLLLFSPDWRR